MKRRIDVPTRQHDDGILDRLELTGEHGCKTYRGSRLDDDAVHLPGEADRLLDLRIANRKRKRMMIAKNPERQRRCARRHDRIAERVRRIFSNAHDFAKLERTAHIVPSFGLDDDDFRVRHCKRDSRSESSAAAGSYDALGRSPKLI